MSYSVQLMAQRLGAFSLAAAPILGLNFDPLSEGAMAAAVELALLAGGVDAMAEMQAAAYAMLVAVFPTPVGVFPRYIVLMQSLHGLPHQGNRTFMS